MSKDVKESVIMKYWQRTIFKMLCSIMGRYLIQRDELENDVMKIRQ